MRYKVLVNTSIIFLFNSILFGQNDWGKIIKNHSTPKAFAEVYFGINALNSSDNQRPDFFYNYKNLNEIGLNSAIVGFDFDYRRVRSSISFIAGNYATFNLAEEPRGLNNIYEANFGFKLLKYHDLWLDVGVMESNLGFESVISTTTNAMTRSLLAENSPYYLNAAKLGYTTFDERWKFELLVSNGWQTMTNGNLSFGHTIQFHPNHNWTINSSSFAGRITLPSFPESSNFMKHDRFFHNFYFKRETNQSTLTFGFDAGVDINIINGISKKWSALIAQYAVHLTEKLTVNARGEYYSDPNETVAILPGVGAVDVFGFSINTDFKMHDIIQLRLEARYIYNTTPTPPAIGPPIGINPLLGFRQEYLFFGTSLSIDLWNHEE
jgi:hypothetical protein